MKFFSPHHADTRGPETRRRPSNRTKDFILKGKVQILKWGKLYSGSPTTSMVVDSYGSWGT